MAGVVFPLLLPLVFLLASVPTGFVLEEPGPSFDLQSRLTVEGAETHPSGGEFLLTSVSLRESRLIYHILSLVNGDFRLVGARSFLGVELDAETQERLDEALTVLSLHTTTVLGLRGASQEVEVKGLGALVLYVAQNYPAYGKLDPGEVIVSVDHVPLSRASELGEHLDALPEGEEVTLGIREIDWKAMSSALEKGEWVDPAEMLAGEVREVTLSPVWDEDLGRKVIGVSTRDYFTYRSRIRVDWEMETVKGPSAGLMMTLSLLDALLPEDLTRGRRIAGTGEVFLDGRVGAIGGLPMKIRAAETKGAEVFLYPRENQEDLAGVVTSMHLIPVGDIEEALAALSAPGE